MINDEIAAKLANAVPIIETRRDGYFAKGAIYTAIHLPSDGLAACVMSDGEIVMDWIAVDQSIVESAEKLLREKLAKLNAEFDAQGERPPVTDDGVVSINGKSIDFDLLMSKMDAELRAKLIKTAPNSWTNQECTDAYIVSHEQKFGAKFDPTV